MCQRITPPVRGGGGLCANAARRPLCVSRCLRSAAAGGGRRPQYLAVSHRWEERTEPDIKGAQLESLLALLNERKEIQYVFYDLMSLPQGADKTPAEQAEFGQQLPNINLIYLGCWVLIMLDRSYTSRFWTLYEAWLHS